MAGTKRCHAGPGACLGSSLSSPLPTAGTWGKALGRSALCFNQVTNGGWTAGLAPRVCFAFSKQSCSNHRKPRCTLGDPDVGCKPWLVHFQVSPSNLCREGILLPLPSFGNLLSLLLFIIATYF